MKRYITLQEAENFILNKNSNPDYYIISSFRNIDKWRAKIILANNGGKKGKMDKVGYIAINLKTNEILPIARSDEHQQGYELLHYLKRKKIITSVKDWMTVFNSSNYVYDTKEIKDWLIACNKWIKYGGSKENILKSGGYNGMPTWQATFEEFIQSKGNPPTSFKGTNKVKKSGQDIINLIETLAHMMNRYRSNMRDNPKIFLYAKKIILWDKKLGIDSPWFTLIYNLGNWGKTETFLDDALNTIIEASTTGDVQVVEEVIFGMNGFKNLLHRGLKKFVKTYDDTEDRNKLTVEATFGDVETAVEEFNKLGGI